MCLILTVVGNASVVWLFNTFLIFQYLYEKYNTLASYIMVTLFC